MSTLFEYDKTEVEEGYYILRVSCDGLTFLTVAQFMLGGWYVTGADYDMWRWSDGEKPKIEIICGLDLDKIAIAAEAEEPLSPVDSRDGLIERLRDALRQIAMVSTEVSDARFRFFALSTADAALSSKEQQP